MSLLWIALVVFGALGVTWWLEEGPERFEEPVPLPRPVNHRFPTMTKAGYKPPRKNKKAPG
jgi:hypothetical protein